MWRVDSSLEEILWSRREKKRRRAAKRIETSVT
jgi:hypothetical protein